jgi:outer membrane receptor protein involved in Fe transport
MRSVVGIREDYFHASDNDLLNPGNSGSESQRLFQPKASLAFGPVAQTELYFSTGRGFHSNDTRAGLDEDGIYVRPTLLVKSKGSEIGVRTNAIPKLQLAVTLFKIDFDSELVYDADSGTTEAGRPSHRTGFEITGKYHPFPWLELSADLSRARARYVGDDPAGNYIEDAPDYIASFGALLSRDRWTVGIAFRDLGAHPLVTDNSVRSKGYSEWNADVGYQLTPTLKVRLDVFNLFNQKSDAADYFYASRLPGEPAEGVEGLQVHPLEPRSARITLVKAF